MQATWRFAYLAFDEFHAAKWLNSYTNRPFDTPSLANLARESMQGKVTSHDVA